MNKPKNLGLILLLLFSLVAILAQTSNVKAVPLSATRTFTTTTDDGHIFAKDNTLYSTAHNASTGIIGASATTFAVGQQLSGGWYYVYRGFLFFDTNSLPDNSTITSVILSLYLAGDFSATEFNVTIQNGQPTYPHQPLATGDYSMTNYNGDGGSLDTTGLTAGYKNITMNATAYSWINLEGTTKLALRSSRDINYVAPTGEEYVQFSSRESGSAQAATLYVNYSVEGFSYIFYGAYNEQGTRDGAINVTIFKSTESPETFELDGNETKDIEAIPTVFEYDLGYNTSRVYYVKDSFDEVWVFKPSSPYYTYYFTIVDLVGVTNGYLEILLNINGTDRIVERWSLDIMNQVPFVMSWGVSYQIRLISDQGSHSFGMFIAGVESSQTLTITPGLFPTTYPGLNVTANAIRQNATWIQVNYTDSENLTSWVQIIIQHKVGHSWSTDYTQNNTGNTHQLNWYSANADDDYLARVTALRNGTSETWSFGLAKPPLTTNPWDVLDSLGTWPFPSQNVIGLSLVLMVFGVFSYFSMPVGSVLGVITAAFLTVIGWMDMNWNLIALAGAVAILAGLAKAKREEREI